jgi:hypothetical protein
LAELLASQSEAEAVTRDAEGNVALLWDVIDRHAEFSRKSFEEYWGDKRNELLTALSLRLHEFKEQKERLGRWSITQISNLERELESKLRQWQWNWDRREDRWQLFYEPERVELERRIRECLEEGQVRSYDEWVEIGRQIREHTRKVEAKMESIAKDWQDRKERWTEQLAFYSECKEWVRNAPCMRRRIKTEFTQKWERLQKCQEKERTDFVSYAEALEAELQEQNTQEGDDLSVQTDRPDLNEAIADALVFHSDKT